MRPHPNPKARLVQPDKQTTNHRILWLVALLLTPWFAVHAADEIVPVTVSPPDHRGLYAIWYERAPEVMELPYITGGQVVAQWGDLEKSEGQYDFGRLAAQMKKLHDQGRMFTVQVRGR